MMILDLQLLGLLKLISFYMFSIYDIRKKFTASQPFKVEFKFGRVAPNDVNGYALVLTNKLVSISIDGHRHFNSI